MNSNVRRNRKRAIVLATGAVLVLLGSAAAFAYWTVGGSGTGTADTGTTTDITVVQTSVLTDMYPGDSAQTLSGNFNNGNTGPVYVGTVTASIASVTKDPGASVGVCDASDYILANAAMTVNAEVPAGNAQGSWTGATIKFRNKSSGSQDECKLATVNLAYAIS